MHRKDGRIVPVQRTQVWMILMECFLPQPPLQQQQLILHTIPKPLPVILLGISVLSVKKWNLMTLHYGKISQKPILTYGYILKAMNGRSTPTVMLLAFKK